MILENFRGKNHHIWIEYEGEILVTNFTQRLKRKITTIHDDQ